MRFAAVVFDWDGTLMDSTAAIVQAVQAAAEEVGLPLPPAEGVRQAIGLGLRTGLAQAWPDLAPERVEAFSRVFERRFAQGQAVLFPGVREMLETLRGQGLRLAIATGASRRGLDHHLMTSGISELFDSTICSDEAFSKPHPQMLERLLARLGCDRPEVAMVGDTVYDLEMARAAGVAGLGVAWGAHPAERLRPLASLGVVEDLAAIPARLRAPAGP